MKEGFLLPSHTPCDLAHGRGRLDRALPGREGDVRYPETPCSAGKRGTRLETRSPAARQRAYPTEGATWADVRRAKAQCDENARRSYGESDPRRNQSRADCMSRVDKACSEKSSSRCRSERAGAGQGPPRETSSSRPPRSTATPGRAPTRATPPGRAGGARVKHWRRPAARAATAPTVASASCNFRGARRNLLSA